MTAPTMPKIEPGTLAPTDTEDSTLPATHIHCYECDTYQRVTRFNECEEGVARDEDHPVEYVNRGYVPLGFEDDADHYNPSDKTYTYPAAEPS